MADCRCSTRRGFALLTVLAVLTIASALALSGVAAGRDAFHAERNRIALEKAWWHAAACAGRARASIDLALAAATTEPGGQTRVWRTLDSVIAHSPLLPALDCTVTIEAAGSRLDANAASAETLDRLFAAIGFDDRAESLRGALLARTSNGDNPLPDVAALARVPGFQPIAPFAAVLSVDQGRVCLLTASEAVLESVPGFSPAVVARILDLRVRGVPLNDVLQLANAVSASDAAELLAHYPEITRITTVDPDAWILTARGFANAVAADAPNVATLGERLVRNGARVDVTQTKSFP